MGRLLNAAICSGVALVTTMKSIGPIFWSPAGSTMFCKAKAAPTSFALKPCASSLAWSRSTATSDEVPPLRCRDGHAGHRDERWTDQVGGDVVDLRGRHVVRG